MVPDRVYIQFEKVVGAVEPLSSPQAGGLTVMSYGLGPNVSSGKFRELQLHRTVRMLTTSFATAFASGKQMPLGSQLDQKVTQVLEEL